MRKLIMILCICIVSLTGCTKGNVDNSTTEVSLQEAESTLLGEYSLFDSQPVIFDGYKDMPIIKDGVQYGTLRLNFVEKLGIWDFNNYLANQNGVRFSYAINYYVDMSPYLETNDMININVEPRLIGYDGAELGAQGYVGWSGYNSTVELFQNTKDGNAEVVLQPADSDINEYQYLILSVGDIKNEFIFDDIFVDLSCLLNATEGAAIRTIDDVTTINSINGGQYTLSFHDVYLELHKVAQDVNLKNGNYSFYDFMYDLNYVKAPTNDREVLVFDSFNKNAIISAPIMEVYSDQDMTCLYDCVQNAERLLWSDNSKTEQYVSLLNKPLYEGEIFTISENRLVPDTTILKPTYIRVVLKFPSEIKARTFNEIRDFDGRYVVYQLPLNVRHLEEKP